MIKQIILLLIISLIVYLIIVNCSVSTSTSEMFSSPDEIIIQPPDNANNNSSEESKACASIIEKCDALTCGLQLHPVLEPEYNMREVAKHCLLLEDHLNNLKKRCLDCVRKHFLIVDGFLEEAVSLEKDIEKRETYRNLFLQWIELEKEYSKNPTDSNNLDNISKKIRLFRKPMVTKYFNFVASFN